MWQTTPVRRERWTEGARRTTLVVWGLVLLLAWPLAAKVGPRLHPGAVGIDRSHLPVEPTWSHQAYVKASNTEPADQFGKVVAVSGNTMVVGVPDEDGGATGVNGNEADNSQFSAGAVYVFFWNGATWSQQAYLKASNAEAGDRFGYAVALSDDTLVVGAPGEDSEAAGVNGDQGGYGASESGAAYVFVRSGTTWAQQAYLKASNPDRFDGFGGSVAVSGDTVVVSALDASAATGVNGNQSDNSAPYAGAAYVFTRNGATWIQEAYLKASNAERGDEFGGDVAVSGDTVVVGAGTEDSAATGVNGNQWDETATAAGAVYVFVRTGTTWTQQAYLKASNTESGDFFGTAVAVSGETVVVGARLEGSAAIGVNGEQAGNSASRSGATYVFVRHGSSWTQEAYLKASNTQSGDEFGGEVAVSGDTVVVGARREGSGATGVDGEQGDNSASRAGAAYVFGRSGATWTQRAYLKASNTDRDDDFGSSVAAGRDWVVVGAPLEDSAAIGIDGNQADNSSANAGAAYVFGPDVLAAPGGFSKMAPSEGDATLSTTPTLTWGPSSRAVLYEYCVDTTNNNACDSTWVAVGTNTSVGLTGLAHGATHYWQVRAVNELGAVPADGGETSYWSFTTLPALGTLAVLPGVLNFTGTNSNLSLIPQTGPQTVTVQATHAGLEWTASTDQPWVQILDGAGTGSGTFTVRVFNSGNVLSGVTTASAQITVTAARASNAPQAVVVNLTLLRPDQLTAPVGSFDTPVDNAIVQGSVAVTGWALDDVEVTRVEIWRDHIGPTDPAPAFSLPGHAADGKVYIASATFVAGTRPDVEAAYPGVPFHSRAGWGYLLLTWGFPNANGTFVLTAIAFDKDGKYSVLGTKAITVNNATATRPFGSIDVPGYGAIFSGHEWTYGWALTPNPGCTMAGGQLYMTMDSAPPNFPVTYGANRTDVAAAFPGFADSHGAGGAVALDSTRYANGVHAIGWLAYDSCGNGDGIGSRFFRVLNSAGESPAKRLAGEAGAAIAATGPAFGRVGESLDARTVDESTTPLFLVRGIGQPATPLERSATVWLSQTGRIELHAEWPGAAAPVGSEYEAYVAVHGRLQPLPVGSSFDAQRGIFYWQPVAGFLGEFPIRIQRVRFGVVEERWTTRVVVAPDVDEVQLQIDATSPALVGWSIDRLATRGSGIGAVHVWARRTSVGSAPGEFFFVGHATLGVPRPDLAAAYGVQFGQAGYALPLPLMAEGTYEVVVYAWSERTARWQAARVTSVSVGR